MSVDNIVDEFSALAEQLGTMDFADRVNALNSIRAILHAHSPFKSEPIDFVRWVPTDSVHANDYNPNSVAPPEMALLEHSIEHDGYTQPVVGWHEGDGSYEVVDGFHRTTVAQRAPSIRERLNGYMPIVSIQSENAGRNDRVASTIRHNRARGKHNVDSMSDIVVELKRRNWTNQRIMKELGMDEDEILRLCQITGLSELFSDQDFSRAWSVDGAVSEEDFEELTDDVSTYGDETGEFRSVNTSDEARVFHTFDKWECHRHGFYATKVDGKNKKQCEEEYRDFLSDLEAFRDSLEVIVSEWNNSCEHYLTNSAMNRIAWLGQAALCQARGIPSKFRSGYSLLTDAQQVAANELALEYLNKWLVGYGLAAVNMDEAMSGGRQSNIY